MLREAFTLKGRLNRKRFLFGFAFLYSIAVFASTVIGAIDVAVSLSRGAKFGLRLAVSLCLFLQLIRLAVQRLHDRGRSAWWLLVFFGPHIVILLALVWLSRLFPDRVPAMVTAGLVVDLPFMAWGMIEILLLRGQPGANRFGPDPLPGLPGAAGWLSSGSPREEKQAP